MPHQDHDVVVTQRARLVRLTHGDAIVYQTLNARGDRIAFLKMAPVLMNHARLSQRIA